MFTCPECRATFETLDAMQSHRLDPYGRKARGEQPKDGRFPSHPRCEKCGVAVQAFERWCIQCGPSE